MGVHICPDLPSCIQHIPGLVRPPHEFTIQDLVSLVTVVDYYFKQQTSLLIYLTVGRVDSSRYLHWQLL